MASGRVPNMVNTFILIYDCVPVFIFVVLVIKSLSTGGGQ